MPKYVIARYAGEKSHCYKQWADGDYLGKACKMHQQTNIYSGHCLEEVGELECKRCLRILEKEKASEN